MHVAYLTRAYIHQDEPWYLNILCVRVTCKVHKSRKPGDHCTQNLSLFLKRGQIFARDHSFGISPVSIDCWKIWANTGPNSVASSFRTVGWSSSGPKALEGFKPLRRIITPSLEITMIFMKGADLSRSGTWMCLFLLNTSVNWPLNSSAFSRSDWATPFPFFFFRGGIPWVSFFLTIGVPIDDLGFALTSPTKLFTYKSCWFLTSALISLLKVSNVDISLLLPVFFAFAWVLFLLRIFLLTKQLQISKPDMDQITSDPGISSYIPK